jgi:hypothetical protein
MPVQPRAANHTVAGRRAQRRAGDRTVRMLTVGVGGLSLMGTGLFSAAAWASTHTQASHPAHVRRPENSTPAVPAAPPPTPATRSTPSSEAGHVTAHPTHHASPLQAPASPPSQPTQPPVATSSGS